VFGKGAAWLAGLPPRVAFWCLRQAVGATLLSVKTFLALLGEEVRRWVVVAVWGLLLFGLYVLAGPVSAGARQVLAFGVLCWFWGAFRAGERTVHNRLVAVRGRQAFRKLDATTSELGAKLGNAKVVMLDGGADMLKALLADPETDAQREQKRIAAAANAAVREHLDPLLFAERSAGPPNPFRRRRARRVAKDEDEG